MDNNVIIELPGGASGAYIEKIEFMYDHTAPGKYELVATHKDGTETVIDLAQLSIDLQVVGGVTLPNGDYQLTVVDPGGGPDVHLVIPLGDHYTKFEVDALLDDKVDKIPGMGLSTEDFTTALLDKLDGYADTLVSSVEYNAATEIITVTSTGPGGITTHDIDVLADKVDKVPGMGLSDNNFTQLLNDKLDLFTTGSVASISFDALTSQVLVTDYNGAQTLAFTIPAQEQANWNVTDTGDPAFIVGKPFIQNQLDNNAAAIATNTQSIIDNEAANNAAHNAMGVLIADNSADIVSVNALVLSQDANINSNQANIAQNVADIGALGTNLLATDVNVATNASDISDLQLKDGLQDGRLDAVEQCCADNNAADAIRDTAISNIEGVNTAQQTAISANTANIDTNRIDIASLDGFVASNATNIGNNTADIIALGTLNTAQQVQLDHMQTMNGMTPNELSAYLQSALNTNILSDVDWNKLQNLNANQMAVDAAQDLIHTNYVTTQLATDAAQDQALSDCCDLTAANLAAAVATQATVDAAQNTTHTNYVAAQNTLNTAQDTALTNYIAQASADFVNVTGDTMTGALNIPTSGNTTGANAVNINYLNAALGNSGYVRLTGDTMTGRLTAPNITIQNNAAANTDAVRAQSYATATMGGTLKARVGGTTLFLSNNGTNP